MPIIASGTQTFAATDTGLAGSVGESVADGVTTFTAGSGISGIALSDADGGSYALQNFAAVSADLSGASGGTLAINGASSADVTLGDGNYGVTVANTVGAAAASFTAGAGSDQIRFDGSGPADFTFGTGTATVWGGSGADSFNFHDGDGLGTIANFSASQGDGLDIDAALKGSLTTSVSGGNTLLSFGDSQHGVLLQGVSNFDTNTIHWT
mgnify:CR=1 FL=1